MSTLAECVDKKCPVPFILTLCPAIINLGSPNAKGQTRELAVLQPDNFRLTMFIKELVEFNRNMFLKHKVPIDIFLIFADVLEVGASNMFTNVNEWNKIALESVRNIQKAFTDFDIKNAGLMQETNFRIPRVRRQTTILEQAGKINLNHQEEMKKFELKCLDPKTKEFELFIKHIKATGETPFVLTGFQTTKSAETVWNRVRFMLAQNMADGIILPKIMKELHRSRFPNGMPRPIFICSTTRQGGIESEMDGFTAVDNNPVIAVFNNIGAWMKD